MNEIVKNDRYREQCLDDLIWVDAEGNEIDVADLTDSHIGHIIIYLKDSNMYLGEDWLAVMEQELEERKENIFEELN
jgi:hypothetical protein